MEHWLELLKARAEATSKAAVALELGVSRTAVSLVLAGKYPGKTDRMRERVLEMLSRVRCPYSGGMVSPADCAEMAGKMPTSSPGALRWWRRCQRCEHNPNREGE